MQPTLGDAPIQSRPAIGPHAAFDAMPQIEGLPIVHVTQFVNRG